MDPSFDAPRVPAGDEIRVITLDNPPVNALSFAYCAKLLAEIHAAHSDDAVEAIVVTGSHGLFSAGADVNDFQAEMPPNAVTIRDVIAAIEASIKVHVAAIEGNCLGGGLELSLACDYRVATETAKLGLPEIRLGLLPGAGGTQRLPRLIGARAALEFMLKGSSVSAERALELGIVDEIAPSDLIERAKALAKGPKRRISERQTIIAKDLPMQAAPYVVAQAHKMVPPEENGGFAAHKLIDAVQASVELPFNFGIAREARLFDELVRSEPSLALRHVFFAERELAKIPSFETRPFDKLRSAPQDDKGPRHDDKGPPQDGTEASAPQGDTTVEKVGVVGAGTMGSGIAIAFAQAGIPVVVVDNNDEAVDKARQTVMGMFMYQVQKGRLSQEEAWKRGQSIRFTDDWSELADCDLIVEAVFENLDVKRDVFRKLDAIAKPQAILASNTSTLDIDALARETKRPERVLGLHFFVPANIMPLLEIVRGSETSPETLGTAFTLAKRLRKKGVLSGNAFGFIGNRMVFDYVREANALAEEGVAPARIDAVMKRFGFPMGPFAMSDLSGLDVGLAVQKAAGPQANDRTNVLERLVEMKRLGQKTMAGYFKYDKAVGKGREPIRDPAVEEIFADEARKAGIAPHEYTDEEIRERLLGALIARGEKLLEEGVALRPGDIDIVYVYGYGFPPHHGGPMWYAKHGGGSPFDSAQGDTDSAQGDTDSAQGDTDSAQGDTDTLTQVTARA